MMTSAQFFLEFMNEFRKDQQSLRIFNNYKISNANFSESNDTFVHSRISQSVKPNECKLGQIYTLSQHV